MEDKKMDYKAYVELYEEILKLRTIKKFIKHNVEKDDKGLKTDYYFGENLLNLIKYIDTEFYNELQQG